MAEVSGSPRLIEPGSRVRWWLHAVLASYGQIFFRGSLGVGALMLLATAVAPRQAFFGLLAVIIAVVLARFARLSEELVHDGLYGYSALLLGLGIEASYSHSTEAFLLLIVASVAVVPITAASHSALWNAFGLPPLTLPFLATFILVFGMAEVLGVETASMVTTSWLDAHLPPAALGYLQSLGAIFFLPRADAGLLLLAALLIYSRIAVLLSMLAYLIALPIAGQVVAQFGTATPVVLGYNFMLTAIALGGVWFVPSLSSFAFAAVGTVVCGLITLGAAPHLARAQIPMLVLPFNLTVLMLLYAMRQRLRDGRPKSVDFLIGSPEENLNFFATRQARFGANYAVRFRAPFLGAWTCTQSDHGSITHQGPWAHAFDFEVVEDDGKAYRGAGTHARDFLCYRLPVLSPAKGTVVRVVDGVRDNPVGEPNLDENWGNLVLIQHGPALYSMMAHLSPGSIEVREGQPVGQGDPIGLCGISGRADVPHLHFQLQATNLVGAPTIHTELHDVVRVSSDAQRLFSTIRPAEGDRIRNVEADPETSRLLDFEIGKELRFEISTDDRRRFEIIVPDLDLFGSRVLRSKTHEAKLFYERRDGLFTAYDTVGAQKSVLHIIQAALCRAPLEESEGLSWEDHLPLRYGLRRFSRPFVDLVSPFISRPGLVMEYSMRRQGRQLLIEGRSKSQHRGEPLVGTRAVLEPGRGLVSVDLTTRGQTQSARRASDERPPEPSESRVLGRAPTTSTR